MIIKNQPFNKRKARRLKHDIQTWRISYWILVHLKHSNKLKAKGRNIRFKSLVKARSLVLLADSKQCLK